MFLESWDSGSFQSDFCSNKNKNKLFSLHSPAFFKILKEAMLAQKWNIPHMKAPILSFYEPKVQGRDTIMRPHPPPLKFLILFFSEVVEAIWGWWNKNKYVLYQISLSSLSRVEISSFRRVEISKQTNAKQTNRT